MQVYTYTQLLAFTVCLTQYTNNLAQHDVAVLLLANRAICGKPMCALTSDTTATREVKHAASTQVLLDDIPTPDLPSPVSTFS